MLGNLRGQAPCFEHFSTLQIHKSSLRPGLIGRCHHHRLMAGETNLKMCIRLVKVMQMQVVKIWVQNSYEGISSSLLTAWQLPRSLYRGRPPRILQLLGLYKNPPEEWNSDLMEPKTSRSPTLGVKRKEKEHLKPRRKSVRT